MYTKNISFLLQVLHTSKQSGILIVEAPGSYESPWQGQFQLENGMVTSCLLRNKADGRIVLTNDAALQWLTNQGKLAWHMEGSEQSPNPLPQFSPSGGLPDRPLSGGLPDRPFSGGLPDRPSSGEAIREDRHEEPIRPVVPLTSQLRSIPQRTPKGQTVPANAFASREHRQVFTLVDGQRTIEEIAYLLHRPPDIIIRVLQELRGAGFIA